MLFFFALANIVIGPLSFSLVNIFIDRFFFGTSFSEALVRILIALVDRLVLFNPLYHHARLVLFNPKASRKRMQRKLQGSLTLKKDMDTVARLCFRGIS